MIKEIYIFKGTLLAESPIHIGSGKSKESELDVIVDGEGRPFIPATSLIGALKNHLKPAFIDAGLEEQFNQFWGKGPEDMEGDNSQAQKKKKAGIQSSLLCSDLILTNKEISKSLLIRDGIRIDPKTGMVQDKKKYDFQIVDRGAKFPLHMEFRVNDDTTVDPDWQENDKRITPPDFDSDFIKKMVATVRFTLEDADFRIGAKTNSGLGRIKLVEARISRFDFSDKKHVLAWFKADKASDLPLLTDGELASIQLYKINTDDLFIKADFILKSSFLIRSYSEKPELPDSVSLKSGDQFVIAGTSLKGAVRARAERILNTLRDDETENQKIIKDLFGHVQEKQRGGIIAEDNAKKGRLRIDETLFDDFPYHPEQQTRIKIDRFTGGAYSGALLETIPVFSNGKDPGNGKRLSFTFRINSFKPYEAGLLLLVLKDLWTGDLAVGGEKSIGRGVFEGKKADISWIEKGSQESVKLDDDIQNLPNISKKKLNNFVDSLLNHLGVKKNEQ